MTDEKTPLGIWLEEEMARRNVGRNQLAEYSGVAPSTISEIINEGHVPKPPILARLAAYFKYDLLVVLEIAWQIKLMKMPEEWNDRFRNLVSRLYALPEDEQDFVWQLVDTGLSHAESRRDESRGQASEP